VVEHQNFLNAQWIGPFPCQNQGALQNFAFKPHPKMYTLKLLINCVAHLTFHVSKLKLSLHDEQRPYQKQTV